MTDLLPLVPSVEKNMPFPPGDGDDATFRAVRRSVLERDGDTCRFCGFRGRGPYMNVHHLDGDHSNQDPVNLATACFHCHAVHHVGLWGDAASLVWLPEMSQKDVSHLSRALLTAERGERIEMTMGKETVFALGEDDIAYHETARQVRLDLEHRADIARRRLGVTGCRTLGTALHALTQEEYARRGQVLAPYRFVLGRVLVPPGSGRQDPGDAFVKDWVNQGYEFRDFPLGVAA